MYAAGFCYCLIYRLPNISDHSQLLFHLVLLTSAQIKDISTLADYCEEQHDKEHDQ